MVKMKLSGMFTLVLGLAAALSQGCGSDSNGNSDGTGSGGSGNANGMTSCDYTKCTGDPSYGLFSQEACDALMKAPCAAEYAAKNKCSLAHDKCNSSDNSQDFTAVMAACKAELDAWEACEKAAMGSM